MCSIKIKKKRDLQFSDKISPVSPKTNTTSTNGIGIYGFIDGDGEYRDLQFGGELISISPTTYTISTKGDGVIVFINWGGENTV